MTIAQEELLRPRVEKFVAGLEGMYREHASDKLLIAMLMHRLSEPGYGPSKKSRADAILEGDVNVAYEAACTIFERMLECGCGLSRNGHHRAQEFAQII